MKKIFILIFINLIYLGSNAQSLWDLGRRSFQDVLKMNNVKPCEITENKNLLYCVENGNYIRYEFKNNTLNSIQYCTFFLSIYDAKNEMESQIREMALKSNQKPLYKQRPQDEVPMAFFLLPNLGNLFICYGIIKEKNGFLLVHNTSLND